MVIILGSHSRFQLPLRFHVVGQYTCQHNYLLVGGCLHPSEKYEFVNWDDNRNPIYGKIKLMATKPPTSNYNHPMKKKTKIKLQLSAHSHFQLGLARWFPLSEVKKNGWDTVVEHRYVADSVPKKFWFRSPVVRKFNIGRTIHDVIGGVRKIIHDVIGGFPVPPIIHEVAIDWCHWWCPKNWVYPTGWWKFLREHPFSFDGWYLSGYPHDSGNLHR